MEIIKRDGRLVGFNAEKIVNAMIKARIEKFKLTEDYKKFAIEVSEDVLTDTKKDKLSVEEIQDYVEDRLLHSKYKETARDYIRYRQKRTDARKSTIDDIVNEIVEDANDYWSNENSNKNSTLTTTQRDYVAGAVSIDQSLRNLLPKDVVEAHKAGIIHFHDMDYFLQHITNCFSSTTRFITSDGVRTFGSCLDGEEVNVLDKDGVWRKAIVHKYGKRKMNVVTLQSGRSIKEIKCTENHRWLLCDNTVTTNLQEGMALYPLHKSFNYDLSNLTKKQAMAFTIGFALGDGADYNGYTSIRLCGDKTQYSHIFIKAGFRVHFTKSLNGDALVYIPKEFKQDFLNSRAWRFMDFEGKQFLFLGYYKADGANSTNRIATTDERILEMIIDISALSGYHIASISNIIRDTNFKLGARIFYVRFRTEQHLNNVWRVKKICKYRGNYEQDAWCVEEPITHSFTLDGGIVTGNCCLINLDDMLQNGTVISDVKIDKPHRFSTACNIATQVIAQVASSQFGGQSISLAHLSPFVEVTRQTFRKRYKTFTDEQIEELVRRDIEAGVQTLQYQIITLMTTNGQAPFVTVYMNLAEVPEGKEREDLALVTEEVLKQRIQGVKNANGVYITAAFPKLIYALDECNIEKDSKYYELTRLAAECSAKRMVPDYISNKIQKELKNGDEYPCMGCRSFLTPDRTKENYAKALNWDKVKYHKYYGRFNQGVVTINLPDVALSSKKDVNEFWKIFDERLELCHKALKCRHNRLLGTKSDVAPILWQNGAYARLSKGEVIDELLYHGYSTISLGYAGLYECVKYMTGKSHTQDGAKEFGLSVMQYMNDKCAKWKAEEDIDYSLYGSPIESTVYKFAKCLKKRFGVIEGVTDRDYITNSYHRLKNVA